MSVASRWSSASKIDLCDAIGGREGDTLLWLERGVASPQSRRSDNPDSKAWSALAQGEEKRGFLIMPFDPALNWLHAEVIHASVAQGVRTRRADDSAQPGPVVQQILDDIDAGI